MAQGTKSRLLGARLGNFEDPAKRAFVGLFIALAIAFIPTILYATQVGTEKVLRLREEQSAISEKVGTKTNLADYYALDAQVLVAYDESRNVSGIIWALSTGIVLLGWYKVT